MEKFPSPGKATDGVEMLLVVVLCLSDDAVPQLSLIDSSKALDYASASYLGETKL